MFVLTRVAKGRGRAYRTRPRGGGVDTYHTDHVGPRGGVDTARPSCAAAAGKPHCQQEMSGDAAVHALAGAGGGIVALLATYPLMTVATRMQIEQQQQQQEQEPQLRPEAAALAQAPRPCTALAGPTTADVIAAFQAADTAGIRGWRAARGAGASALPVMPESMPWDEVARLEGAAVAAAEEEQACQRAATQQEAAGGEGALIAAPAGQQEAGAEEAAGGEGAESSTHRTAQGTC